MGDRLEERLFSGLKSFRERPCTPESDAELMIEWQSDSDFFPSGLTASEVFGACHG